MNNHYQSSSATNKYCWEHRGQLTLEENTYEIKGDKPLGEGSHGFIWAVQRMNGGGEFALKTVRTTVPETNEDYPLDLLNEIVGYFEHEIECLKGIQNAEENHIMPLVDCGEVVYPGRNEKWPVLVLPLAEASLTAIYETRLKQGTPIVNADELHRWARGMLSSLKALHEGPDQEGRWIHHRDVKPDNFLLMNQEVYLTDFGTVKKSREFGFTGSKSGTFDWAAPEQIIPYQFEKNGNFPQFNLNTSADIYSVGRCLYALIAGSPQANAQSELRKLYDFQKKAFVQGVEKKFGTIGGLNQEECTHLEKRLNALFPDEEVSKKWSKLLQSMLDPLPEKRPTAAHALESLKK